MALIRLFLHVFDLSHSGKTVLCLKANLICGCCFLGSGPVACLVCCFFGENANLAGRFAGRRRCWLVFL